MSTLSRFPPSPSSPSISLPSSYDKENTPTPNKHPKSAKKNSSSEDVFLAILRKSLKAPTRSSSTPLKVQSIKHALNVNNLSVSTCSSSSSSEMMARKPHRSALQRIQVENQLTSPPMKAFEILSKNKQVKDARIRDRGSSGSSGNGERGAGKVTPKKIRGIRALGERTIMKLDRSKRISEGVIVMDESEGTKRIIGGEFDDCVNNNNVNVYEDDDAEVEAEVDNLNYSDSDPEGDDDDNKEEEEQTRTSPMTDRVLSKLNEISDELDNNNTSITNSDSDSENETEIVLKGGENDYSIIEAATLDSPCNLPSIAVSSVKMRAYAYNLLLSQEKDDNDNDEEGQRERSYSTPNKSKSTNASADANTPATVTLKRHENEDCVNLGSPSPSSPSADVSISSDTTVPMSNSYSRSPSENLDSNSNSNSPLGAGVDDILTGRSDKNKSYVDFSYISQNEHDDSTVVNTSMEERINKQEAYLASMIQSNIDDEEEANLVQSEIEENEIDDSITLDSMLFESEVIVEMEMEIVRERLLSRGDSADLIAAAAETDEIEEGKGDDLVFLNNEEREFNEEGRNRMIMLLGVGGLFIVLLCGRLMI